MADGDVGVRLVLLGPPGSGKGTLATQLDKRLSMVSLSTGEIFRQAIRRQTALGTSVQAYVSSGGLVPDQLVVKLMVSRLTPRLRRRGFVLDGFPRTVGQAEGLEAYLARAQKPLHGACYLACTTPVLIARLSGRRVCGRCGAIYHLRNMPPKRRGACDRCDGRLVTRKDDRVATIRKRLALDHVASTPLLNFYARRGLLVRINGNGSSEAVYARAMRVFRRQGWIDAGAR